MNGMCKYFTMDCSKCLSHCVGINYGNGLKWSCGITMWHSQNFKLLDYI